MKTKKSEKANLEEKRFIFFQIGIILSLSLVFFAFEWKSYDKTDMRWETIAQIDDLEEVMITQEEQKEKEVKKPIPKSDPEIVDDNEEDDDFEINVEDDLFDELEEFEYTNRPEQTVDDDDKIFVVVQKEPQYQGGLDAMYSFLADNMKYPEQARQIGIEGDVYIGFVVEKNGTITNVQILRDIGAGCGEEAMRVVNAMPNWIPGEQRGKKVRVQFTLPVSFKLHP